ncbi:MULTISPECIES: GntR family transcriptional regulator [unclassified Streptomyces]|uniref:GntR family transcriptional regulator n=1 Tax=unclassified Streptomyces TaxID=2593676 RepID=UPI0037FBC1C0
MTATPWTAGRLPAVKSKADLVYEKLHAAIASGTLHPGERINMDEFARAFGVSKIPVREAVKRLESEGLVTSRVHSGVTVTEIDRAEIRGVFLAREAIEGLVGRLAAENAEAARAPLLPGLRRTHDEMRAAVAAGDARLLSELNTRFHRLLAEATGYRILTELTEQLLLAVQRYRVVTPKNTGDWPSVLAEHEAILDALDGGDSASVAEAARRHAASQARKEAAPALRAAPETR